MNHATSTTPPNAIEDANTVNIQPTQQVPANSPQSNQQPLCLCHDRLDCPTQATVKINANQLADLSELLHLIDGFLRHAGIADHLADYLHAHRTRPPPTPRLGRLPRQPAHRPDQFHRPRPARPPPTTATVNTRHR